MRALSSCVSDAMNVVLEVYVDVVIEPKIDIPDLPATDGDVCGYQCRALTSVELSQDRQLFWLCNVIANVCKRDG